MFRHCEAVARNTQCTKASALSALDYSNVVKGQITALREVSDGGHNFHCDDTCWQNQTEDGDRHAVGGEQDYNQSMSTAKELKRWQPKKKSQVEK